MKVPWNIHFVETPDPPKAGKVKALCGEWQIDVVPVYGEVDDGVRLCQECTDKAVEVNRRFRSYLIPRTLYQRSDVPVIQIEGGK
jgi:hypothetical protein